MRFFDSRFVVMVRVVTGLVLASMLTQMAWADWLPATPEKLPRWRGFNLQNMLMAGKTKPFQEWQFKMIHDFGFNFVRIPMDYRIWIVDGDWNRINEDALKEVDRAVAFGEKYQIHICLNFHRAPGYTVAQPRESRSLWTDPEAQRVCAMHWATFARRYKGIPNERLSFDLINEPLDIDGRVYAQVIGMLAAAIRQEDPDRLIIADGTNYGYAPCPELIPLHVAESTRAYQPLELSHYRAPWVANQPARPPIWPPAVPWATTYFYGPTRPDLHSTLVLTGDFPAGTQLKLMVDTVATSGELVVQADQETVFDKIFTSGPESKEGEKVVYVPQDGSYQNIFQQAETIVLPKAASRIEVNDNSGNWLTLSYFALQIPGGEQPYPLPLNSSPGHSQAVVEFQPENGVDRAFVSPAEARQSLWGGSFARWKDLENQGVGVMVGEWGCYNRTPYEVTLRWMEDNLANFQKGGWGWALWNFSGPFGILDSKREGAVYEEYEGHQLDRRMLELLQRY